MGCCSARRSIRGNIVFKPIEAHITKCNHKELDSIFDDMAKALEKTENTRKKIADTFKNMTISTGACVLKHPTFERCVSSFIIVVLLEIVREMGQDTDALSKFDFKSLFKFQKIAPFVSLCEEKIEELKSTFRVDLLKNEKVANAKNSIIEFVQTLSDMHSFFAEQGENTTTLINDSMKALKIIKDQYQSKNEAEHISLGQAIDYIKIAEKNLENVKNVKELSSMMGTVLGEILFTVYKVGDSFTSPSIVRTWIRIAQEANEKKVIDAKEVVFIYSRDQKLKRMQDWENNFVYIEEKEDEDEELRF